MDDSSVLLIGLSGCSSAGKTTLARLLRDVWPNTVVLHEDDFYWPDEQIPTQDDVQNWDCLESIDVAKLHECLRYIKANGALPPDFQSKEDLNAVGNIAVDRETLTELSARAQEMMRDRPTMKIAIIDGFLLYSESMVQIRELFDVKLFLRTELQTVKARREARAGYVTIDGFWEDPPGYVEKVVWPNHVQDHAFLFEKGDVEGPFDSAACKSAGIAPVPQDATKDMTACAAWACGILEAAIRQRG